MAGSIAAAQASIAAGRFLHANAALQQRRLCRDAGHRTRMDRGVGLLLSFLFEEVQQKKRAAAAGVRRRRESGGGRMPKSHETEAQRSKKKKKGCRPEVGPLDTDEMATDEFTEYTHIQTYVARDYAKHVRACRQQQPQVGYT